jgi:hypothetical protein
VFESDRVLVAHRVQVPRHHATDRLHLGLGTKCAQALDLLGQDHVIVRDVRNDERANTALTTLADRAGATGGPGGQQAELAGVLLDDDLPRPHRFGREQVELFQAAVAVGQEVDSGGEAGHREARCFEGVLHLGSPELKNPPRGRVSGES